MFRQGEGFCALRPPKFGSQLIGDNDSSSLQSGHDHLAPLGLLIRRRCLLGKTRLGEAFGLVGGAELLDEGVDLAVEDTG